MQLVLNKDDMHCKNNIAVCEKVAWWLWEWSIY